MIPDCPHTEPLLRLVLDALADLGLGGVRPRTTIVASAEARGFAGSPTILIDGTDPFASSTSVSGLACRVYPGPSGLPSLSSVRAALAAAR
ncbi:MAG TPA: hypothetical protein VH298_01600 [Jatrophihabitans sp.]|nr:hypothetical protein [Jatrophihabitans sp.]